jgi:shikimate kinase
MNPKRNIFLIGPMGAGKSTVGRQLASLLGKSFRDADQEIEARTGVSISLIFEIEGEAGFRQRETALLDELTRGENLVLATGGGAVLAEENRRRLRERGTVVYLNAPLEILLARTARDRSRPLLQTADRRQRLEEILAVRDPLYRETAHLIVETDQRPPAAVAREIARRLEALHARENAHP